MELLKALKRKKREIELRINGSKLRNQVLNDPHAALDLREKYILKAIPEGTRSALDVGFGSGCLLIHLSRLYDVSGIEFVPRQVKILRKFIKRNSLKGTLYEGSIYSLPFNDDSFDVVICCEVIEHLKDVESSIKELYRVTKKRLIITTPEGYSFNDPGHVQHFNENDLLELLENYHFEMQRIITKEEDVATGQRCFLIILDK